MYSDRTTKTRTRSVGLIARLLIATPSTVLPYHHITVLRACGTARTLQRKHHACPTRPRLLCVADGEIVLIVILKYI